MLKFSPKKRSVAACAALLISSAPAFAGGLAGEVVEQQPVAPQVMPAQPSSSGYYVSLFAGAHSFSDVATEYDFGDGEIYGYTVEFDTGFVAGITLGRRMSETLRVEAEISFARAAASEYYDDYASFPAEGDLNVTYLLANAWYDIPTSGALGYYVGGGIGAAKVTADIEFDENGYGFGDGETKLAAQLGAGVTYDLSQTLALDGGYRFKYVADVDFEDIDDSYSGYTGADIQSHSLQVGLIYSF